MARHLFDGFKMSDLHIEIHHICCLARHALILLLKIPSVVSLLIEVFPV